MVVTVGRISVGRPFTRDAHRTGARERVNQRAGGDTTWTQTPPPRGGGVHFGPWLGRSARGRTYASRGSYVERQRRISRLPPHPSDSKPYTYHSPGGLVARPLGCTRVTNPPPAVASHSSTLDSAEFSSSSPLCSHVLIWEVSYIEACRDGSGSRLETCFNLTSADATSLSAAIHHMLSSESSAT